MITEDIGQRIKQFRNSQKLSQVKLALNADPDYTHLAGIDLGREMFL